MPAAGRTYGGGPRKSAPKSRPAPRSSSGVAPSFPSYVPPRPGATRRPAPKPTPAPRPRPVPTPPRSSSGIAPNFPRYVPKRPGALPPPKPKPPPPPTKIARAQEQQYKSQAGAVRRAAKVQARLGPGVAVRPPEGGRQVLTDKRITQVAHERAAKATEQSYKSLGESVAKQATQQQATRSVKVGGFKVPAAAYSKDPAVLKAAGFKKAGALDKATMAPATIGLKALSNVPKDLAELAVTTPTSLAHLGVEGFKLSSKAATGDYPGAFKQGKQIVKEQVAPYKEAIKHPVKFATEHPVTSYLMFAPGVKLPLRGGARVARLAGKASTKRAPATLPGTAFKEARTAPKQPGSPNLVNRLRGRTGATVTGAELKRAVDEEHDLARHREERRVAHAIRATKAAHKNSPKHVRQAAVDEATKQAREKARVESDAKFAQRFGANVEPAVSAAHVAVAEAERVRAKQFKRTTRGTIKVARGYVRQAQARARTALADAPSLRALEAEREAHQRELARTQREHGSARVGVAEAKGRAAVSQARPATSPRLQELHGQRGAVERTMPRAEVHTARADVRTADRRVNTIERQLQRADERASHLEGVTVGRAKAGRMTAAAGRMAADQAERVGHLNDALTEARRHASDARDRLKAAEHGHRGRVREATKAIDAQIRAENRRIGGVAPREHNALLSAIEQRDAAAGRTHATRAAIRNLDQQIADERRVVRLQARAHVAQARGEHQRAVEQHGTAVQVHRRLRNAAIDTARAHRETPLVNPAGEGRLFNNELDAKRVAYRLNQRTVGRAVPSGGLPFQLHVREPAAGTGRVLHPEPGAEAHTLRPDRAVTMTKGHGETPVLYKARQVGDGQYAVLPNIAAQRLYGGGGRRAQLSHASVGTGKATGAKLLRTSRGFFTQATLPASLKWLGGQGAEAVVRGLVAGVKPGDRALFHQVVERMNELAPGAGDEFALRVRGGQFGETSAISEQMSGGKTLAEEFQGTPLRGPAAAATMVGETAPARVVRGRWRQYSHAMTSGINGLIENTTREAMAGKAMKQGPALEHRVHEFERMRELMGKTNRAVEDAARHHLDPHSQAETVRTVDEMYGKYSRWSPEMRSLMLHWTPFLPWYLNTARFLFHELPSNHPGKAALLANMNAADQEWRKQHHLSLYGDKAHGTEPVPEFLMGSYPSGKGYLRVGHYTPWGVGSDLAGSAAGLMLPQVLGPIKNLGGVDWKWQPLTKPGKKGERRKPFNLGEKAARAAVTGVESQVPLAAQVGRWTGLTPKYVDKRADTRSVRERLMSELPTTPTKKPVGKTKATKPSSPWGGGGGFGGSGWGSGGW